jgi:hypothetical protein
MDPALNVRLGSPPLPQLPPAEIFAISEKKRGNQRIQLNSVRLYHRDNTVDNLETVLYISVKVQVMEHLAQWCCPAICGRFCKLHTV